ncbi:MAG: DUF1963 domain-containing protein [Verrucomicrobiota bacterium]
MNIESIASQLRRRAIVLEIGGFRPPESRAASWFGRVNFALPGESWPMTDGKPMHALCQINLTTMPFRPPRLDDLDFITVFVGPDNLPVDQPNGSNWCLRAYPEIKRLVPLATLDSGGMIKPFPMRPKIADADFPMWEDVQVELPQEIADSYYDHFENVRTFKLGGWPTLIQSEIFWAPRNLHPAVPEYVFQIDTTEKGNWMWGDNGVGYFGRGTADGHLNEWVCEWQCY